MKILLLLGVIFLTGCTSMPTLEELEDQAFLTGNWSAVEKRESLIARRELRQGPQCPGGMVAYCEKRLGSKRCACVSGREMSALLSSWGR